MTSSTAMARCAAISIGGSILAASAYAVIAAGHQDLPHATLTATLAAGVFAGACAIGSAWSQRRRALAAAIGLALLAGEGFGMLMTADRIVAEREAGQATVKAALARHEYATAELVKARDGLAAVNAAAVSKSAEKGCAVNCRALLEAQVTNATAALDNARTLIAANPKPTVSGSPLADRLGVPAWSIDLAVAALLSIGANGLAAGLIAFGAHGGNRAPVAEQPGSARTSLATGGNPQPPRPGNRRSTVAPVAVATVATKAAAEADVIRLVGRGEELPSQDALARRWQVHKATASKWIADFERRGIIRREWDGRCNRILAA